MSKLKYISNCKPKTINLAKQGNRLCERKTKLLILEFDKHASKKIQPCMGAHLPVGLTNTPPTAKRIRVCTGADMKRTCPPKMCQCPPKVPWTFTRILGLGLRCLIAGGLVYWTYSIGLWGDASQTEQIYVHWRNTILKQECPPARDVGVVDDKCLPPRLDKQAYQGANMWNSAVGRVFGGMSAIVHSVIGASDEQVPCEEDKKKKR